MLLDKAYTKLKEAVKDVTEAYVVLYDYPDVNQNACTVLIEPLEERVDNRNNWVFIRGNLVFETTKCRNNYKKFRDRIAENKNQYVEYVSNELQLFLNVHYIAQLSSAEITIPFEYKYYNIESTNKKINEIKGNIINE